MIKQIRVRALPKELYEWQEKIEKEASLVGLDFFETRFEMLPYDKINDRIWKGDSEYREQKIYCRDEIA